MIINLEQGESSTAVGETSDWINELPDCILSYILSSLRIKDAAETSIVCHRWRNLWKTRPSDLVLDIANIFGPVYAPFVARHERYYTFASMTPRFERQCYIQKHLSLYRCVLNPATDFDRFIHLTTLYLNDVKVDPNFLAHLFSACSLLESLTLTKCNVCSDLIIGPSLHLHDLKVLMSYRLGRIVINAVNLSSLEFDGYYTDISFMRTPKLVSFYFKGWLQGPLPNVLTLLTSCPELSTLQLQIGDDFPHLPQNFPALRNLKQLKLDLLMLDFELGSVLHILRGAPLLEELLMTVHAPDYHGHMKNLSTFSHNHLRRIKMQGFQGMWSEIEFAIYLLKIATKLEVMVIDPLGSLYNGDGTWFDITCCYQCGNENEHPELIEGHTSDLEYVDEVYNLLCWQKRGKAAVQERLKEVKTEAQVIILLWL